MGNPTDSPQEGTESMDIPHEVKNVFVMVAITGRSSSGEK
jgi:hypothetical protein